MPRRSHLLSFSLLGLTALCLASCGGDGRKPVYPVKGKVLVRGQPARNALIVFHPLDDPDPRALRSHGRVGADGAFQLSTYTAGDGAPAGAYAVTFFWPKPPAGPVDDPDLGPDQLQNRFTDPKATKYRAHIQEGPNELEPFVLP